jgi:vacuolar-type H+-ATPase subunit I/STV1
MVDQTSNIFEGSDLKQDQAADQKSSESGAFQVPETVANLVGEGKKYSDVNKALESIPHAQTHIERLEQELAETRAKLEAQASVEEALKEFRSQKEQDTPTSQPIDLSEIDNLIEQRLTQKEQRQLSKANVDQVVSKLTEQFGGTDKAEQAFIAKAQEIGVDLDYMNDLAAKSPKAVFALFGSGSKPANTSVTKSSVNTEAFGSQPQQTAPVKGVMHGSSTSDVLSAWRAATSHIKGD